MKMAVKTQLIPEPALAADFDTCCGLSLPVYGGHQTYQWEMPQCHLQQQEMKLRLISFVTSWSSGLGPSRGCWYFCNVFWHSKDFYIVPTRNELKFNCSLLLQNTSHFPVRLYTLYFKTVSSIKWISLQCTQNVWGFVLCSNAEMAENERP